MMTVLLTLLWNCALVWWVKTIWNTFSVYYSFLQSEILSVSIILFFCKGNLCILFIFTIPPFSISAFLFFTWSLSLSFCLPLPPSLPPSSLSLFFLPLPPLSLKVSAFTELLESSGGEEEDGYKALTALGLISAVQSLVKSAFSKPELLKQMESVLIGTIASIFQNGIMG